MELQRGRRPDQSGFSMVELLVVAAIIGTLATIAIPTFFAQREKGWRAQADSALRDAALTMAAARVGMDPPGGYGMLSMADLRAQGLHFGPALDVQIASASDEGFCVAATHEEWQRTLYYDSGDGKPGEVDCSGEY